MRNGEETGTRGRRGGGGELMRQDKGGAESVVMEGLGWVTEKWDGGGGGGAEGDCTFKSAKTEERGIEQIRHSQGKRSEKKRGFKLSQNNRRPARSGPWILRVVLVNRSCRGWELPPRGVLRCAFVCLCGHPGTFLRSIIRAHSSLLLRARTDFWVTPCNIMKCKRYLLWNRNRLRWMAQNRINAEKWPPNAVICPRTVTYVVIKKAHISFMSTH